MHGSLLCTGSQAWSKYDVTRLNAKCKLTVKSNTSMHQAIRGQWHQLLGSGGQMLFFPPPSFLTEGSISL